MILRTPRNLGALIRDRRRKLALDQSTLAERVGVSRQWIGAVERGRPSAHLGLVLRTLQVLGIRLSIDDAPVPEGGSVVDVPDIDAIVRKARKRPR